MKYKKFPKSIRKHIRIKKADIRREILNTNMIEKAILYLYQKFKDYGKRNR